MSIVIVEGMEKNVMTESGNDPFHPLFDEYHSANTNTSRYKDFIGNYGYGSLFPGGPVCE